MTAPTAHLTLHPRVYRRHLERPRVLPEILSQTTLALFGTPYGWDIRESEDAIFIDATDYDVSHPQQGILLSSEDYQLGGAIVAAITALMLSEVHS